MSQDTNTSASRANAARVSFLTSHLINKYNLVFIDAQQASCYDVIVSRKICAPNYLDVDMVNTLLLCDDLRLLLRNLGWENFVALQEPIYEQLFENL